MAGFKDLTGKKFGRWTVLSEAPRKQFPGGDTRTMWNCACECGSQKIVQGGNLTTGRSISCGCLTNCVYKLDDYGESPKVCSEERIWKAMLHRCYSPANSGYERYGGRGITVCDRWRKSLANFLSDMGPRPSMEHSLDRKDNNGNYEPDNCQWATKNEQQRNQRRTRYITAFGKTMNLYDWAAEKGMRPGTIRGRISRGYSPEEALTRDFRKF